MIKKQLYFTGISLLFLTNSLLAQLNFAPKVNYGVGNNPFSIFSADFNNDGKMDIATANANGNDVSILLGNGSGTFAPAVNYGAGNGPYALFSADFNNDGKMDIATANFHGNSVSILMGSGTGTFTPPVNYGVLGNAPISIFSADFNGDGNMDLATANYSSNNLSVLLGSSTGTFAPAVIYSAGSQPWSIFSADFNSDGKMDLATANFVTKNVSILLGSNTGTFAPAVNYNVGSVGSAPRSIFSADFNGDNKMDLATANSGQNVSILLGSGTGTFAAAVNYTIGSATGPRGIFSADFNGDNKMDLVMVNEMTGNASVLLGSGTGSFASSVNYGVGFSPYSVYSADFNGDGKMDIASANFIANDISVLLNTSCITVSLNVTNQQNILCRTNPTGAATVAAIGGAPFTYTWSPSGGNLATAAGLGADVFTCVVTNSCGSTANKTVEITQPASVLMSAIASTTVLCTGGNNGSATITASGGTAPYVYLWHTGATTSVISTQTVGIKSATVTDANGCVRTNSTVIVEPSPLSSSTVVVNVLCHGGSTGSATVNVSSGTSPYNYLWSSSSTVQAITGLNAGVRTVTVTDANGCSITNTVTITQPASALTSAIASTTVLCTGGNNGSATITASGGTAPYTYLWHTAATTSVLSTQTVGIKSATVTDANACVTTNSTVIVEPSLLTTTMSATNVLCNGGSTGSATVSVSGGTGVYNYLWDNNATTAAIVSQTVGIKTVTVTDGNNCTSTNTIIITHPTALASGTAAVNVLCNGNSTGAATVTANGGTAPYNYLWSSSQTTSTITSLNAGVTTVTVTDANNCTITNTVTITQPSALTLTISPATSTLCQGGSITYTINNSGGTGAVTYSWSTGASANLITISPTTSTNYTAFVTDANGCSNNVSQTVTVISNPTISLTGGAICDGETFTLSPSGANTYTYSGGSAAVSPTTTTSYSVMGASVEGCVSSNTAVSTVTVYALPIVSVTSGAICNGKTFTLTPSGATTYTYSNGSPVASPTITTSYSVTGTNADGCVSSNTAISTVTVYVLPNVLASSNTTLLCTGEIATLSAMGAVTYTWNTTETTTDITITPTVTETYTVMGTDANGCTNTSSITQSVSLCSGVDKLSSSNNDLAFKVYPNPASQILNIELETEHSNTVTIEILNLLGEVVYRTEPQQQKTEINISGLTNGVYFVNIVQQNKQQKVKLIKQ